ncbi:UNVERIFIED_CONTAM: Glycine-rich RNA-binding protein RZ1B [Sesamum latifolium]|uniref:Glycine-rich RNA-binding protein RZ1B n=1 Tax=Sesamum latifolium TaxID=2727402 RepID=A0AAW2XEI8_9LAMI
MVESLESESSQLTRPNRKWEVMIQDMAMVIHQVEGGYGGDRSARQDDCFKCGRPGLGRDCPSAGAGRGGRPFSPPRARYAGTGGRGDRHADYRDRYVDDRYDRGRYGDRDRYDIRDDRYGSRDRYMNDRYPPAGDRFPADRYGAPDRYPQNVYGKDRAYDRDAGPRGSSDRYGGSAGVGPPRYEGRSYRERPGPYDRPRRGGRPPSLERY